MKHSNLWFIAGFLLTLPAWFFDLHRLPDAIKICWLVVILGAVASGFFCWIREHSSQS